MLGELNLREALQTEICRMKAGGTDGVIFICHDLSLNKNVCEPLLESMWGIAAS